MKSKDPYYEHKKKWREEHRERCRVSFKRWYRKNKEKFYNTFQKWRKNNPEGLRISRRKYKELYYKKYPIKIKALTYAHRHKQRRYVCELCEICIPNLHFHHTNYEEFKGITVCKPCHDQIHKFDKNIGGN